MNVLIVGCGKVGSRLANFLDSRGHDVSVVDRNGENFRNLDNSFSGAQVSGVPIDQDVLSRAGIHGCDALAALSEDDNVNVMVSQLAREIFNVPRVIARVFDPKRTDVFSHFGLKTICPTNLTVEAVYSMLMDTSEQKQLTFDSSVVAFDTSEVSGSMIGEPVERVKTGEYGEVLFGVLHEDGSLTLLGQTEKGERLVTGDRLVYTHILD